MILRRLQLPYYPATLLQLFLPLFLLWLSRFGFILYNSDILGELSASRILSLTAAGLRFDLCAWAWFNSIFILLRFLPFPFVGRKGYQALTNSIYLLSNSLMLLLAIANILFFRFNGAHLRWQSITTIWSDPNMLGIIISFSREYWWGFLFALLLIFLIIFISFGIKPGPLPFSKIAPIRRISLRTAIFVASLIGCFLCIRGHIGAGRPLSIGDAVWGTSEASQMNIVLNTPFSVIRSLNSDNSVEKVIFFSDKELCSIRNSIHTPPDSASLSKRNIMVITIESGSAIWVDALNPVKGDTIRRLMPFLDSIAQKSVVFPHAFTTGVRSIEGLTAIFTGVPTFGDMILISSPYYANAIDSPALLLGKRGYASKFYFGGNKGSFNIDQTLALAGFNEVVSREDYGMQRDFDGQWGVWDHKMAEFVINDLASLPQPFFAGWFTLNPHGPYGVPDDWKPASSQAKDEMHLTVEYEDYAIRHFFDMAKKQPWYQNTTFLIIGDHGFRDLKGTIYDSYFTLPAITMMIYTPDGSLPPRRMEDRIVAQYDLPPTILSLLGYPEQYAALGSDAFDENRENYALMFIKGGWQVCGAKYLVRISYDLKRVEKVYDWQQDPGATTPLSVYDPAEVDAMQRWAQAFMQDYSSRLIENRLSASRQTSSAYTAE